MDEKYALSFIDMQGMQMVSELQECNEQTARYGLVLSKTQIQYLVNHRSEVLRNTGRIEFGKGILKKLIREFSDSPYIYQDDYEQTLIELQEVFYHFKNESMDRISDDELISYMKKVFDGWAQGSLEYLSGTSLEELCRNTRYGVVDDGMDVFDEFFRGGYDR